MEKLVKKQRTLEEFEHLQKLFKGFNIDEILKTHPEARKIIDAKRDNNLQVKPISILKGEFDSIFNIIYPLDASNNSRLKQVEEIGDLK